MNHEFVTVGLREQCDILDTDLKANAIGNRRLATVDFRLGELQLRVPNFAEIGGQATTGFQPTIEALLLRNLLMIVGVTAAVIFDLRISRLSAFVPLFRREHADRAWFSIEILERVPAGFVVVYEGGVFLLGEDGLVRWHQSKAWDDILVEGAHSDAELQFFSGDDGNFSIRVADGSRN